MRMVLIRHGQSEANARNILQGHFDSPLSRLGIEQAKNLAHRMLEKGFTFDLIYSSDLSRAANTARIIGKKLDIERIIYSELLRELDLGVLVGKNTDQLDETDKELLQQISSDHSKRVPEGENINSLIRRLRYFLDEINSLDSLISSILVVTHGGVLRHLFCTILNVLPESTDEWFKNCSMNELIRVPKSKKWKLTMFNEIKLEKI